MSCISPLNQNQPTHRRLIQDSQPNVLADIYQEETNIVVWQRDFSNTLSEAINCFLTDYAKPTTVLAVNPENTKQTLEETFGAASDIAPLFDDIALIVDMFCCLFAQKRAGLRLTALSHAMCPSFHVDKIPCRLVTTYQGIATQWIPHEHVNLVKLAAKEYENSEHINQLTLGDVAILKGENWSDTVGEGLVHRSPAVPTGEQRLLLTLDLIDD